jgi:phospholipid/cholesterol/gamma-HCH transport system substrate-binding protein
MDPAKRSLDETRVGLFTLFALILLVWGWGWLKSFSLFSQPQRFTAQFGDVAGLSRNATVNIQGVRVGTVEYMEFVHDKQHPEHNSKINVHVKITDSTVQVPEGSHISIQTLGLVGAKYIEIVLPHDAAGNVITGRPLGPNDVLVPPVVEEPVRVELVINRVASRIDDIVSSIDTQQAGRALNNLSQATAKLNKNMDRLQDAAESVKTASQDISATANKFGSTADNATIASERASSFFATGNHTMENVSELANEFRGTSRKVNKLLDNPAFSGDMKEAITQARQTAEVIRGAINDVGTTLKDKELRTEVVSALSHLETSTNNIKNSLQTLDKISGDQGLRSDLKDVVSNARAAMNQASTLLNQPDFKANVCATLNKVRAAASNIDVASRQVQQVLNKRAPLLHMLFGRPGAKPAPTPDDPSCSPKLNTPNPAICPPQAPPPGKL